MGAPLPAAPGAASPDSGERGGRGAGVPSPQGSEGRGGGLRRVIVGGTGLYLKALTEGLAPIPEVPAALRAAGEAELRRIGLARFAARLAARDPQTAAALDRSNPRRVLRAWEVLEATGTGLAAWRALTPPPLVPLEDCTAIVLDPPRPWLYARCDARLDAMLAAGALDEVRHVMQLGLPPHAPGMKAVGAAELAAHLAGAVALSEAAARAKTATRRYAKRQLTWMRNQMAGWTRLDPSLPDAAERAAACDALASVAER
jgi:tRNA dimethylallyltransferase